LVFSAPDQIFERVAKLRDRRYWALIVRQVATTELGKDTMRRRSSALASFALLSSTLYSYAADLAASSDQEDETPRSVLAVTGLDVTSQGSIFSYGGVLIAPSGDLDKSGFRIWIFGEAGTYKYDSVSDVAIRGREISLDLLAGYGFEGNNYSINLLIGGSVINHTLSAFDPDNPVQGTAVGLKLRGEAWLNPTPQTLAAFEAEYATAFQTHYAKGKLGYDFSSGKEIFFGPEATFLGDERYEQWRIGAHVTGAKLGKIDLELGAGYLQDSNLGPGIYGTVGLNFRF